MHGGLERGKKPETKTAMGQKEINDRIQKLQFRDARTKIKQVDAHPTLGGGVVIQVRGEGGREREGGRVRREREREREGGERVKGSMWGRVSSSGGGGGGERWECGGDMSMVTERGDMV